MARYKLIDTSPRLLAIDLSKQLRPGTFEHALNVLVDHELDLAHFDARFQNDSSGAPAYPPAVLLKIVVFAYAQGIIGSRAIARACVEHVTFIALAGDSQPHFTTIARFVSTLGDDIAAVFGAVVALCQRHGLLGAELIAIDGVKLPSHASKHKSGTRAEFEAHADKLESLAQALLAEHRAADKSATATALDTQRTRRIERLTRDAAELRDWLARHPHDRLGTAGKPVKSNRTDIDSAKLATDKGVIQGYTAVAAVDSRHQLIVAASAHGTSAEHALLIPTVEHCDSVRAPGTVFTADAGYYSHHNLVELHRRQIPALIADNAMRKRDPRLRTQARHRARKDPLHDKRPPPAKAAQGYPAERFIHDPAHNTLTCPAGKRLYHNGQHCVINGRPAMRFRGAKRDCIPCTERSRCLRTPDKTQTRQVSLFLDIATALPQRLAADMRARLDSTPGRTLYGRRFGVVEPVFGNLRYNKGLDRFTLRGQRKVNGQWLLYCLVHNIEKLAKLRYAV